MDDWNDFGAMPPSQNNQQPPTPQPVYIPPTSSNSSLNTLSETSIPPLHHPSSSSSASTLSLDPSALLATTTASHSRPSIPSVHPVLPVLPVLPNHNVDRSFGLDNDVVSAASDSDVNEPPTVSVPRIVRDVDDHILRIESQHSDLPQPRLPKRGELDDIPDDYELNIEGFRLGNSHRLNNASDSGDSHSATIPSSFLRRINRCYTKLEVISARQIKVIISVFNLFAVIAICYAVMIIIAGNLADEKHHRLPLPLPLATDEQRQNNVIEHVPSNLEDLGHLINTPRNSSTTALSEPPNVTASSAQKSTTEPSFKSNIVFPSLTTFAQQTWACEGIQLTSTGFRNIEKDSTACQHVKKHLIVRQEVPPTTTEGATSSPTEVFDVSTLPPDIQGLINLEPVVMLDVYFGILPLRFADVSNGVSIFFSLFFFILGCLFAFRLFRIGRRNITHEQIWVLVLLFVAALYFNALEAAFRIIEKNSTLTYKKFSKSIKRFESWVRVIRDLSFSVFCYFYLWASLHSYRILDPSKRLGFREFYLWKILVLLPYGVYQIVLYAVASVDLTDVPLLAAPAMAYIFSGYNMWSYLRTEMLFAIGKTLIEVVLTLIILYEGVKTAKVLGKAPYMKYRTKRVGFRFFMYVNIVFYSLFILLRLSLLFGKPKGSTIALVVYGVDIISGEIFWYWNTGPIILLAGYVLCTAHVHLPYTSIGLKGWFVSEKLAPSGSKWSFSSEEMHPDSRISMDDTIEDERERTGTWSNDDETPSSLLDNDSELQKQIIEPVTYRKRESKDSLELKANCFTMQTHVIMFNFSWYVYYYGTPKLDNFRPKNNPLPFSYCIAAHVKSEGTDTQALVVDCMDRIIISFKGTTSMKNLRTSLHMSHERLANVVRINMNGEDESTRLKGLFGSRYTKGKIHKGFAVAYMSVAKGVMLEVQKLRDVKKRPVFLTGHSLGGALATICSLDLWFKLDISRREIFVSTFGSPRVGNYEFSEVYREVIPLHWRIVVDPDMIAKLPNVGYTHVGKKVVLTPHGEMIIDPSALEHRPWSGEAAGFAYHRKASYLLAMRAWCVRNHGMTYTPNFWPFPVRPEDERRFAGAFDEDDEPSGSKVAAKIIRMDAMVDILGIGDKELANMAVVEKWARLTRRALLNAKLTKFSS